MASHPHPALEPGDELELVARLALDPAAFGALYEHYAPRVYAFAHRRCGDRGTAEDITSVTFERALRNLASFDPARGRFGPWLFGIASNSVADHYDRQRREQTERRVRAAVALTPSVVDDATDPVDDADEYRELRGALDRLRPRYRRAIELCFLAELDHGEAAEAMGVSRPTMRVLLHRALRQLRDELPVTAPAAVRAGGST